MLAAALLKPVEAGVKVESMGASDVRGCVTDGARGSCVIPFDGRAVSTVYNVLGQLSVCNISKEDA
jgi:hypothetical protein